MACCYLTGILALTFYEPIDKLDNEHRSALQQSKPKIYIPKYAPSPVQKVPSDSKPAFLSGKREARVMDSVKHNS